LSKALNNYLIRLVFRDINTIPTVCIINTQNLYPLNFIENNFTNKQLVIYDWSDDFEKFTSDDDQRIKIRNNVDFNIINSDVVFCINENLLSRAKELNNNSYLIKNATNFFTFENNNKRRVIDKNKDRPVIGYLGWINDERLDLDLMNYLAEIHKDVDFIFVGPKSHKGALEIITNKYPNVKLLPSVPYLLAPQVIQEFDVCILPNKINEHTAGNDPIKIFDYLASGKPIVSTRTAGTENLEHLINIADDKETFSYFLNKSLKEKISSQARVDFAKENSWAQRYLSVKDIIIEELENKYG
jgi:glycosyltransferase involved in cell wall biosynthesis